MPPSNLDEVMTTVERLEERIEEQAWARRSYREEHRRRGAAEDDSSMNTVLRLEENRTGRDFVVDDVHGAFTTHWKRCSIASGSIPSA